MTPAHPLAVVGNVNVDLILGPVTPWPLPGTEIVVAHDDLRVGGAAGNAALAWAALGVAHQIAANTGSDPFGDWLRARFAPQSDRWPRAPGRSTVSVGVTHPDGERTFLTTRGHLAALDWPAVQAMLDWPRLAGGTLLLCGSFITEGLLPGYPALFAQARRHGIAVALDTGWPPDGWTSARAAEVSGWLSGATCALFNAAEAMAQTGAATPADAAAALRALMPPGATAVVKCGAEGALAAAPDGRLHHAPAPAVTVIDTIGAGDAFNASFLAAQARGADLPAALAAGTATASRAISTLPRRYTPEETQDVRARA